MANIYAEKRSDVADMCQAILDGKDISEKDAEHRFIKFVYDGKTFQYDTLTTEVEVGENGGWKVISDIEYTD